MRFHRSGSILLSAIVVGSASCSDPGVSDPAPAAVALRFLAEPTPVTSGTRFQPAVAVMVVDAEGRLVREASNRIQVAILPGTGREGATLSGAVGRDAENGVARFDDLAVANPGAGYQLLATAPGLRSDTSQVFDVDPRPTRAVAFRVEPSSIAVGEAMSVEVALLDTDGSVIEGGDAEVFLSLTEGTGDPDAHLQPAVPVVAVDGVARVPELTVSTEGQGYTLTAIAVSSGDPTYPIATSLPFDVGPWAGSATSLTLHSDPGDFIGQGGTYEYDQGNAVFEATDLPGEAFRVRLRGDESWQGDFSLASGQPLAEGTYAVPTEASIRWGGEGRGCEASNPSSLTVDSVTYVGGVIMRATLSFEQYCDGSPAALSGSLHYDRHDTTVPPGPVRPIPGDLWVPGAEFTPPGGSYVYLASEEGDFIGAGDTLTYTPDGASIETSFTGERLSITVVDVDGRRWTGDFVAMNSVEEVEEGYYPDLRRFPFHNPAKGGLDWAGHGRGCNRLTGWFAVDEIVPGSAGGVSALHLRFEQFCDGSSAALRGVIHLEGG